MDQYAIVIALANATTLVAGGLVTRLAYRAFDRTGATALRAVALGIGLIVVGTVVGGLVHLFGVGDLRTGIVVQSACVAGGFVTLLYSVYAGAAVKTTSSPRWPT